VEKTEEAGGASNDDRRLGSKATVSWAWVDRGKVRLSGFVGRGKELWSAQAPRLLQGKQTQSPAQTPLQRPVSPHASPVALPLDGPDANWPSRLWSKLNGRRSSSTPLRPSISRWDVSPAGVCARETGGATCCRTVPPSPASRVRRGPYFSTGQHHPQLSFDDGPRPHWGAFFSFSSVVKSWKRGRQGEDGVSSPGDVQEGGRGRGRRCPEVRAGWRAGEQVLCLRNIGRGNAHEGCSPTAAQSTACHQSRALDDGNPALCTGGIGGGSAWAVQSPGLKSHPRFGGGMGAVQGWGPGRMQMQQKHEQPETRGI